MRFLPRGRSFGVLRAGRLQGRLPPGHELLSVAETSQRETFLEHLRRHERHQTTYLEMSRGLAQSGIEKWTIDTDRMTMTYYDKAGKDMLVEQIS